MMSLKLIYFHARLLIVYLTNLIVLTARNIGFMTQILKNKKVIGEQSAPYSWTLLVKCACVCMCACTLLSGPVNIE